jgi:hypothetical protein
MRSLVLVAALIGLHTTLAAAQTVPLVAVEITGGTGPHTTITPRTLYVDDNTGLLRFAGYVRLGSPARIRPVLLLEYTPGCGLGPCGESLVCIQSPRGGCYGSFREPNGTSAGLGVAGTAWRLVGTAAAGVSFYQQRATFADASLAARLFWRISAVVDARYIRSTDDLGNHTWFTPISAGLRVY